MDSLKRIRQLIRDTERQIKSQQSVVDRVNLNPAAPPDRLPNRADRLVEVDPLVEAHRSRFGPPPRNTYTHPEQYDPALRWHLNMPPAADPYEEARRMHAHLNERRNARLSSGLEPQPPANDPPAEPKP
jgi:hypothetical protein